MTDHETRQELAQEVAAWLDAQRERWVTAANAVDIPTSVLDIVYTADAQDENSWRGKSGPVPVSPATMPRLAGAIEAELDRVEPAQSSPAAKLYRHYGEGCHVWYYGLQQPRYEDDPTAWIERILLKQVLHDYLCDLPDLDLANVDMAQQLAQGLVDLLEADEVTHVTALPVGGLRLEGDSIKAGKLRLRKLSALEFGYLTEAAGTWPSFGRHPRKGVFPFMMEEVPERLVLEVRRNCPKGPKPHAGWLPQKTVLALQLLGFDVQGRGEASTWTEPGPSHGTGGQQIRLPRGGLTRDCSQEDLQQAATVAGRIPDEAIAEPQGRNELALHRFMLGAADENQADALIDFVIVLEALLLPKEFQGELRFRLALHCARLLEDVPSGRKKVFQQAYEVYGVRSKLVHGSRSVDVSVVADAATKARKLASRVLLKGLETGWPTQEDLLGLALS
ncbi:MAG: HEPN domain-containing protein [Planctomycetota bacterium]|nr:HEPN domain-containing protein [Planctomycetota bacterium]